MEIKLTQNKVTMVDDSDFEYLNQWKWYTFSDGYNSYVVRNINNDSGKRTLVSMHREILKPPQGFQIDHADGDGLNNQRANLRICTAQQNGFNRKPQRNRSSQYKGVTWDKNAGKWKAQITMNGKVKHLGLFDGEQDAARVYDKQASRLFGKFANLNNVG